MQHVAEQDGGLVDRATHRQVLQHVHGLADKWIPLFMQPGVAFGFDLPRHFVLSASLTQGWASPRSPR